MKRLRVESQYERDNTRSPFTWQSKQHTTTPLISASSQFQFRSNWSLGQDSLGGQVDIEQLSQDTVEEGVAMVPRIDIEKYRAVQQFETPTVSSYTGFDRVTPAQQVSADNALKHKFVRMPPVAACMKWSESDNGSQQAFSTTQLHELVGQPVQGVVESWNGDSFVVTVQTRGCILRGLMHGRMGETYLEGAPISRPLQKANVDAIIGSSNPMGSGWWTSDRMLMGPPVGDTSLASTIQQSTTATGTNLSAYVSNRERSLCLVQPRNSLDAVVEHSNGSAAVGVLSEEADVLSEDNYSSAELALMRLRNQVLSPDIPDTPSSWADLNQGVSERDLRISANSPAPSVAAQWNERMLAKSWRPLQSDQLSSLEGNHLAPSSMLAPTTASLAKTWHSQPESKNSDGKFGDFMKEFEDMISSRSTESESLSVQDWGLLDALLSPNLTSALPSSNGSGSHLSPGRRTSGILLSDSPKLVIPASLQLPVPSDVLQSLTFSQAPPQDPRLQYYCTHQDPHSQHLAPSIWQHHMASPFALHPSSNNGSPIMALSGAEHSWDGEATFVKPSLPHGAVFCPSSHN